MKIVREGKVFQLTKEELLEAYEEQRHLYDKQNVIDNINSGAYLEDEDFDKLQESKYYDSFYEDAACTLREKLDDGLGYEVALTESIEETVLKWKQKIFE